MNFYETVILALGLAMDACAVSICKGLSMKKMDIKKAIIIAFYFGFFQAAMPLIGFFLGTKFSNIVENFDHWIAFILIGAVGVNMIKEAIKKDEEDLNDSVNFKIMVVLAIATSIDALAAGITLAFLKTRHSFFGCYNWNCNFFSITCGCENWK